MYTFIIGEVRRYSEAIDKNSKAPGKSMALRARRTRGRLQTISSDETALGA